MSELTGVGSTALMVAACRAREMQRPDRLFEDRWAWRFLYAAQPRVYEPNSPATPGGGEEGVLSEAEEDVLTAVAVRTRFFDDLVLAAAASGVTQVVLLGAGLDTRAYRLNWPVWVRVFEVDTADVLEFKKSVLRSELPAGADRVTVPVDLRDDWSTALVDRGFGPDALSVWIVEGVLHYLDADHVDALMNEIAQSSPPGTMFGATLPHVELGSTGTISTAAPCLWKWSGPPDSLSWLTGYGWRGELFTIAERAADYGRSYPPGKAGYRLVSAIRT